MNRRPITLSMLCVLLVAILTFPTLATTEDDCKCHDRPGLPCVKQRVVLEDIVFDVRTFRAANDNEAHKDLYEAAGDSEVWVLIETVPSGACAECAQTYILYAPERDVKSDRAYHLFTKEDVTLTASRVVFSMVECSEASLLTFRIAIIEEDDSYSNSLALLSLFLSTGLLLGETGDRSGSDATEAGWSARIDGAWLDSLVGRLTLDEGNELVLPATAITSVTMDGDETTTEVGEKYGLIPRWVQVKLRGDSYKIGCDLRCSEDDAPTDAEKHLSGRKLCDLGSLAATAESGFTEETSGAGLPTNAVKRETSVKRETRTRADGTKVEYTFIARVVHFRDGSVYLELYAIKRVIGPDGKATETIRDCLQATSLRGFDRAKIRSLVEIAEQTKVRQRLSGGTPSFALALPAAVNVACGIASTPEQLDIMVPSNAVLDLTSLTDLTDATGLQPLARESITICADEIILPEGQSLEAALSLEPRVYAAVDTLLLFAPEACTAASSGDRVDVVVANGSGERTTVRLTFSDTCGWVVPQERELSLAPGEATMVTIPVNASSQDNHGATCILCITASTEALPHVSRAVELRLETDGAALGALEGIEVVQAPPQDVTEEPLPDVEQPVQITTTAPITVPDDIAAAARLLAWKGAVLGRTDPMQRWSADEDDPGEFCEPCGHTPMCVVCMDWDLQEWQLHRRKSVADLVTLMALLSYLTQVSGLPEYYAVAAIYWEAHWDGWHNRDRPW